MVQPTVVTATPRFFSIIHNQFLQSLNEDYQAYLQANKEGILEMVVHISPICI